MTPTAVAPARARKTQTPYSNGDRRCWRLSGSVIVGEIVVAERRLDSGEVRSVGRPPPLLHLKGYIPLEHFLAVASHCMPAFLQAASVLGAPAKAGAATATIRLKAMIDTNVFMGSSDAICLASLSLNGDATPVLTLLPRVARGSVAETR